MFAVLKTGGKQYKVAKDDIFAVEKLAAEPGQTVQFNDVLMLGGDNLTVGAPFITGAAVQAEVLDQFKGPKTIHYVKRRRKHSSQRKKGHRQQLTKVRIVDILASGAERSGVMAAVGGDAAATDAPTKAAPAKPASAKAAAPKKAPAKKAPAKAEAAAATAGPKNLLTEAKGTADDLKKISGVGPKLEGTLNKVGVYHFWQIAEWTPEDVAQMDDLLSFKGRIDRDDWIKQAAGFAADAK